MHIRFSCDLYVQVRSLPVPQEMGTTSGLNLYIHTASILQNIC